MVPFHAIVELQQNSAGKDLDITNIDTKAGPPNRQISLSLNSLLLSLSKQPPFGKHQQFRLCFTPLTLIQITNVSL